MIRPGETLRTPRMSLQFFDGAEDRGVNIWRRWYNAHVLPRRLGEPIEPTVVFADNGGGVEWQEANEQQQLDSIREVAENFENVNLWWIDAGWYPCRGKDGKRDWTLTGSWYPDPERFPNGLAPIGKACDEAGMDLLVWFEPERIRPGLKLAVEHPEWMLKRNDPEVENMLLDLTNPDCFQWICETFVKLFNESGIKCYPAGLQLEPLLHWRDNEPDDRKGMLENLYVQAIPRLLGLPADERARPVDRLLRLRRPPQRPGDHAPLGAPAPDRLRLRLPPHQPGVPAHPV